MQLKSKKPIYLSQLTIADLCSLMSNMTRQMEQYLKETGEIARDRWNDLDYKRKCIAAEVDRRLLQMVFTEDPSNTNKDVN